jgi:CRISPR-associated protein, csn1 family
MCKSFLIYFYFSFLFVIFASPNYKTMKNILGLDLGTTSIGFAHIVEDENKEKSEIKELGVRIVSLTTDEQSDFEKGK